MIYFILFLHLLVILFSFGCFAMGVLLWRRVKKVSEYWKFFTIGFLFTFLSELIDIFAPVYEQQFGGINFYTEATQTVGMGLIILALIGFLRERIKG